MDVNHGEPAYKYRCMPENVTLLPHHLESYECKQLVNDFYKSVVENKSVEEVSNMWSKVMETAMNMFPLVKCKPHKTKINWMKTVGNSEIEL